MKTTNTKTPQWLGERCYSIGVLWLWQAAPPPLLEDELEAARGRSGLDISREEERKSSERNKESLQKQ
jgi:hypothetical protein